MYEEECGTRNSLELMVVDSYIRNSTNTYFCNIVCRRCLGSRIVNLKILMEESVATTHIKNPNARLSAAQRGMNDNAKTVTEHQSVPGPAIKIEWLDGYGIVWAAITHVG